MAALKVLAVRLGAMGDVIHALPAVTTLKTGLGDAHLTWLVEPRWRALLEGNPFVDDVWTLERSNWDEVRRCWRQLRSGRFDFAVDLQGLMKSALAAFAGCPHHVYGFHYSLLREKAAALLYSHRVRSEASHIVDQYIDIALTAADAARPTKLFPLPPGQPEGLLPDGAYILASPMAGWGAKQWPPEYYRRLAELIRGELGVPLVLNGPPSAETTLRSITGTFVHASGVPGLIDATRRAAGVIGVDSGPLHLAAALRRPGVAIFGPTDPARNGPYGDSISVLRASQAITSYKRRADPDPSMRAITPDQVLSALKTRLLGETRD
jgi:heptosyltransferase-1